jgi:Invasin, domain 3/FG-GAP repeat
MASGETVILLASGDRHGPRSFSVSYLKTRALSIRPGPIGSGGLRRRLAAVVALGLPILACGLLASPSSAALFVEDETLTAHDSSSVSQFGTSIAIEGNTMVVGAPYDEHEATGAEGAAFVYAQTSPGTWSYVQTLAGDPDLERPEMFGSSVAIDGNTMVIGAPHGGYNDTGAAYVFTRASEGADWTQSQTLSAETSDGSYFGSAVAISSGTIVVGAYQETPSTGDVYGAAYVYTQPSAGATFSESSEALTSPAAEEQIDDSFGFAVAVSGQTIYVGACDEMLASHSEVGSVYAYTEASAGDDWDTGVTETTLPPPTTEQSQAFGYSLAIQGSTLVVGADELSNGTTSGTGGAFVYTVPADGDVASATEDAKLQPTGSSPHEPFWGGSVAIDDAAIVLGSAQAGTNQGGPYVYSEPSSGWSSSAPGEELAVSPDAGGVGVSGTTVAIGQPGVTAGAGDAISFSRAATKLSLGLSPSSIAADGSSTSVATATVTDASGDRATAENVTFSASDPGVKIGAVTNNGNGTYSATLTSSTSAGAVTITATDTSAAPTVVGEATLTETSTSSGGGSGGSGGSGGGGSGGGGGLGGSGGGSGGSGGGGSGGSGGGSGGSGGSPSPQPPTSGQLSSSLLAALTPKGKHATLEAILEAGGFVFTYEALEAGKLAIDWYQGPAGAHAADSREKAAKSVLVAEANVKLSKAGKVIAKVKLTAAGARLFRESKKLRLTAKVSFTPTGKQPKTISRTKTFTLK